MAIRRMISRDLAEFREFQTRTVEVGRIRTGQFVVPEGGKGRPVKLDRFRLTSDKEEHIQAAAGQYGGEARPYQPQGGGTRQWEVVTELGSLEVLIINGQLIDPVYEMWGAGRTCIRRCDGEWNTQTREACLCNGPNRPSDTRQLCKVTTRVQVMLPSVAGLHAWRLETHSENAAVEMASPTVGGLVRIAQVPVPATLYLRREQRRERNHDKQKFETKDFYVPTFHIRLSALELAAGPEAITAALVANGAPAALAPAETRRELEAAGVGPVSAVPAQTPRPVVADGPTVDITLSERAMAYADEVAAARRNESRGTGRERDGNEVRTDEKQWDDERLGIRAEAAVWSWLHPGTKPELHVNVFNDRPDVDPFDVKSISDPSRRLLHRPHEADDRPLLLVLGRIDSPDFRLLGWRWAWECRRDEWLDNPGGTNPLWMVPQAKLYPMTDRGWEDPPQRQQADPLNEGRPLDDGELPRILAAIEKATTLKALDGLREAFAAQNVRHKRVFDAWVSRKAGIEARDAAKLLADDADAMYAEQQAEAYANPEPHDDAEPYIEPEYPVGAVVEVGGIEFVKHSDGGSIESMFGQRPQHMGEGKPCLDVWCAQGPNPCGFTPNEHLEAHGAQAMLDEDRLTGRAPAVEGTVEGDGLPMVPDGDYDQAEQWSAVVMLAGRQSPAWSLDQTRTAVCQRFGLKHAGEATGQQLARVAAAMKAGML